MALSAPISMDEIVFEEPACLLESAKYFQEGMKEDGVSYTDDKATIAMMISSVANESHNAPAGKFLCQQPF